MRIEQLHVSPLMTERFSEKVKDVRWMVVVW